MTDREALKFLFERGYTIDMKDGYLMSPHENGLWSDDKEQAAIMLLTESNAD
jgi:hypothetical protein